MDDQSRYESAKKRVEEIKGFYVHFAIYILVNAGLFILNVMTDSYQYWFKWPLFGWGIGVAAHAISVFGVGHLWGPDWEARKIKQIMDRDGRSGPE